MTAAPLSAGGVGIKTWVGFVAMAVGMFLAILDTQIVASSLPEIQTGLGIPLSQLSWVQTAYLMAEIVAIPLTGWLTRIMSTRGAFVACVCGFTAASLACAASTSFWSLVSDAGTHPWTERRRLHHRPLFLALAVPDQRAAGHCRGVARPLGG